MPFTEYQAQTGNVCPFCRTWDIVGGPVEVEAGKAWQHVTCSDCGAEWRDDYTLSGMEVTGQPDDEGEE
jgi:DNA-directed RNA polymerase subunit RPC12/RpoP